MRARHLVAGVVAVTLVTSPALAAMDVATFIAKADALRAKGMMALFSSDLRLLQREAKAAAVTLQAEKAERIKTGQPPNSCPPKGAKLGAEEFVATLKQIPVAEQTMPLSRGMAWVSRRKFPCR